MDLNTPDNVGSRTRSRIRARINTAIPKESGSTKKWKSRNKSRKSPKRKIAHVSLDSEINLNVEQIHLSNNSHVMPECPSNYADNEAIQGSSEINLNSEQIHLSNNSHVMPECPSNFADNEAIQGSSEINLNAEQLHLSNNSHVMPECPSNFADNEAIQGSSEINLNAEQLHLSNNSHVMPECPSNYADNELQSVIILQDDSDDEVIYHQTTFLISDSENEAGYDSDVIYDKMFVATGSETPIINDSGSKASTTNQTLITVHDSGINVAAGNNTSIIVNDIVSEVVPGNETSVVSVSESDVSLTEVVAETSTAIQQSCTDVSPNDVSIHSQISDVSSLSLQSINNSPSETNPGCIVSKNMNKHFARRHVNLKRLKKNCRVNEAQASLNPSPPRFNRKCFQRSRNFFPSPRINLRPNQRLVRDNNNIKKRPTTVSFAKAMQKNPRISKKLQTIRAKEQCKELLTNTCNFKKFNTIAPAYGAHAKATQPKAFNSKFNTIKPTESYAKAIDKISFNSKNYNTINRGKRMVLLDGSNLAFAHSSQKEFSVKGIVICLDYFSRRGHEVKAVVPQMRLKQTNSTDRRLLEQLNNEGKLILTPCKSFSNGHSIVSYDDPFILDLARKYDAAIISNDNFRDLHERYKKEIRSQVIGYTFFKNTIIFPEDPYGRKGPSLNEILTK